MKTKLMVLLLLAGELRVRRAARIRWDRSRRLWLLPDASARCGVCSALPGARLRLGRWLLVRRRTEPLLARRLLACAVRPRVRRAALCGPLWPRLLSRQRLGTSVRPPIQEDASANRPPRIPRRPFCLSVDDKEMVEPEAAVAILHTRGADGRVLVMRRAERTGDSWSGHWSFPGGRRDPRDPDLLDTALRELAEECGIHLGRPDMEDGLPHMLARRSAGPFVLVAPFVFAVDSELRTVLDAREAVETVWLPMSFLRDPSKHRMVCVPGRPGNWLFPAVDLPVVRFGGSLIGSSPPGWGSVPPKDPSSSRASTPPAAYWIFSSPMG